MPSSTPPTSASPFPAPSIDDSTMVESTPLLDDSITTGYRTDPTSESNVEDEEAATPPADHPSPSQETMEPNDERPSRKHFLSPNSAAISGPSHPPPQAARDVPSQFIQPLNWPGITFPPPNSDAQGKADDPFIVQCPPTRSQPRWPQPNRYIPGAEPRPAQSPAPSDACSPSLPPQDLPATPQDGQESKNFLSLGTLIDFVAHGVRPSSLLNNLDKDRLASWLTIPNAFLALPLDAKYSATGAQAFRNNLSSHLARAFPSSAATIEVHPPVHHTNLGLRDTQPWGFLVHGLSPGQKFTLISAHLWLSLSIGFIAIDLHHYTPSPYVISIRDMGVNLNEASEVIMAITTQMTTPGKPIHNTLQRLGIPQERIESMIDACRVIPRGYTIDKKESMLDIKDKRSLPDNNSITIWEVYIPPPFDSVQDTNPGSPTPHDAWVKSFTFARFQSPKSSRGSAIETICHCFTCKSINHSFPLCPIHEHPAWSHQHPEISEGTQLTDEQPAFVPPFPRPHSNRASKQPRQGKGTTHHP